MIFLLFNGTVYNDQYQEITLKLPKGTTSTYHRVKFFCKFITIVMFFSIQSKIHNPRGFFLQFLFPQWPQSEDVWVTDYLGYSSSLHTSFPLKHEILKLRGFNLSFNILKRLNSRHNFNLEKIFLTFSGEWKSLA